MSRQKTAVARVEATLHELLQLPSGEAVKIPVKVPFAELEEQAHTWSNATVQKFFALRLELMSAYDLMKDANLTGLDLVSMAEELPHPALPAELHPMHKIKIYVHAQRLRRKVIDHAKKTRPEAVADWDASHVASWLHIEQGDAVAAMAALRGQWTGATLEDVVRHHGGARGWSTLSQAQQQSLLTAITLLIERQVPRGPAAAGDPAAPPKKKEKRRTKKTRAKTALTARRAQRQSRAAEAHADGDGDGVGDSGAEAAHDDDDGDSDGDGDGDGDGGVVGELPPPSYDAVAAADRPYVFDRFAPAPAPAPAPSVAAAADAPSEAKRVAKAARRATAARTAGRSEAPAPPPDDTDDADASDAELLALRPPPSPTRPSPADDSAAFLRRIAALQRTVTQHATQLQRLQSETQRLQRDKDRALRENAALREDRGRDEQRARRLAADRDVAAAELDRVVALFAAHAQRTEAAAQRQLDALDAQVRDAQLATRRLQTQPPPASPSPSPSPEEAALRQRVAAASATIDGLATATAAAATAAAAAAQPLPPLAAPSKAAAPGDSDLDDDDDGAARPAAATAAAAAAAPPVGRQVAALLDALALDATQPLQRWRRLLQTLRLPRDRFASTCLAGDTRQLLLLVATRWVRLGGLVWRGDLQALRGAGRPARAADAAEDAATAAALEALRRCARALLEPLHRQWHHHAAHDTRRPAAPAAAAAAASVSRFGRWRERLRSCGAAATFPDDAAAAVAVVFCLATLQRHLARFADLDAAAASSSPAAAPAAAPQLTQLRAEAAAFFAALATGALPPAAVSRDNLRDFAEATLGLALAWPDHDAVAQRIDRDRSGFVRFDELFGAFASLHPTLPALAPPAPVAAPVAAPETLHAATCLALLAATLFGERVLALSLGADDAPAASLGAVWLRLLTTPPRWRASAAKFRRFLQRLEAQRAAAATAAEAAEATLLTATATAPRPPKKTAAEWHRQLAQDEGVVAALLLEATADACDALRRVTQQLPTLRRRHAQRRRRRRAAPRDNDDDDDDDDDDDGGGDWSLLFDDDDAADGDGDGGAARAYFVGGVRRAAALLTDAARAEEVALLLAHGLGVYAAPADDARDDGGGDSDVLRGLAQSVAAVWQLRHEALAAADGFAAPFAALDAQLRRVRDANPQLSLALAPAADAAAWQRSQEAAAAALGLPLRGTCAPPGDGRVARARDGRALPALHRCQLHVEALLRDLRRAARLDADLLRDAAATATDAAAATAAPASPSSPSSKSPSSKSPSRSPTRSGGGGLSAKATSVLAELQRSLHDDLWGPAPGAVPAAVAGAAGPQPQPPSQVVAEANEALATQRVEQVTRYLDALNRRAARKKQLLAALLSLWQSAKLALKAQQFPAAAAAAAAAATARDRALAQPVADIVAQTRALQDALLRDMQRREPTPVALLEGRVLQLQAALRDGQLRDETGALAALSAEVDAMRASLLQANNDAMRLSARILQHLRAAPAAPDASAASVAGAAEAPPRSPLRSGGA
jgi:hypothetical protein